MTLPETPAAQRPLRSLLYMPASNPRTIAKARMLDCDAVTLDLEDAVAPEAKQAARATLVEEARAGGFGHRMLVARINALQTPWGHDDLAALAGAPLDALLAPKVDTPDDIAVVSQAMDAAGYGPGVALWAMIETPAAVLAVERIAAMAASTRLAGFVLGLNDLSKDSGIAQRPGRAAFVPVMVQVVLAARANGLAVLDGVCNAIDDPERIAAECLQARDLGMDGKTLIHPSQIDAANRVFAPDAEAVAAARAVVEAFGLPENLGKGALKVNGRMVELLHRDMALALIARAEAIAKRENTPGAT